MGSMSDALKRFSEYGRQQFRQFYATHNQWYKQVGERNTRLKRENQELLLREDHQSRLIGLLKQVVAKNRNELGQAERQFLAGYDELHTFMNGHEAVKEASLILTGKNYRILRLEGELKGAFDPETEYRRICELFGCGEDRSLAELTSERCRTKGILLPTFHGPKEAEGYTYVQRLSNEEGHHHLFKIRPAKPIGDWLVRRIEHLRTEEQVSEANSMIRKIKSQTRKRL